MRILAFYLGMIAAAVVLFLVVNHFGVQLTPSAGEAVATTVASTPKAHSGTLLHVLVTLAAVMVVGRLLAPVCRKIGQPPVIAEVLAGIFLGPSLLGWLAPSVGEFVLPASVAPYLSVVANLGVVLYMFAVGLELNASVLHEHGHTTIAISHASIVVPFSLGTLLALWLYPTLSAADVSFTVFALFLGVSMSVTAFPVLARILTDRQMTTTDLGILALACAATDDVTAWCLLAMVAAVARSEYAEGLRVIGMALAYVTLMFVVLRPLATRWARGLGDRQLDRRVVTGVLLALLLSAIATEAIGIHAIFGAFLLGAIIPHDSAVARQMRPKLEDLVSVLLLPAFFALTGMRTSIGLVSGWQAWLQVLAIIAVATAGKFGGSFVAARLTGLPPNRATAIGVLMNTRGLMELIVLNIGLDLGVISQELFTMMVLMALVTTMATGPVLAWLGIGQSEPAPAVR